MPNSPRRRVRATCRSPRSGSVIHYGLEPGVWCVAAGVRAGKVTVIAQLAREYFRPWKQAILVTHSNACLIKTVMRVLGLGVPASCIIRLGHREPVLKETTGVKLGMRAAPYVKGS